MLRPTLQRPSRCVWNVNTLSSDSFGFTYGLLTEVNLSCLCAAPLHWKLPAWVWPRVWQPEWRGPNETEGGALRWGEQVSSDAEHSVNWQDILNIRHYQRKVERNSTKQSFHVFLNADSPWHHTSSGACGQSSRPGSPPSSLDTWWEKVLLLQCLF